MKRFIPLILTLILSILKTNGQCVGNEIQSGSTAIDDFDVSVSLDCGTQKVELSIEYKDYTDNWFGIVFHHTMVPHKSLVYTTGKEEDRSAALYAYDMTSKRLSNVNYDPTYDWTEVDTITEDGYIHIIYEQDLTNTEWDINTYEVGFRFAVGSSLKLELHEFKTAHATLFLSSQDSDTSNNASATPTTTTGTREPTSAPITSDTTPSPTNADNDGCGGFDYRTASDSFDDFDVIITINCIDETVKMDMTYNAFKDNWFGVVLNNEMKGDALIYTSGKSNDRDEALYFYSISEGKSSGSVVYNEQFNWREIETNVDDNGVIRVVYEQDLDNTGFDVYSTQIPMRWAFGAESAAFRLAHHQDRASTTKYFDLNTGGSSNRDDDLSKQYAHGALMWSAWSVFATIGIMSSAFRWILPNKNGLWFNIHRGAQSMVLILHVIGFIIAVLFTEDSGIKHFSNNHMIIGLVVTVLVVLQPLNALFRPHPVGSDKKKPLSRFIWEIVHKSSGYIAWILAAVTAYLGFNLDMIDEAILGYIHLFGWCLFVVVLYIILSICGCLRKKKEEEVETVNDDERDDDNDDGNDDDDDDMEDPGESDQFVGGRN